ncbi:MAG: CNNM domain-containing protein [Phycisphaerales bacterium]|nr:CNNM domain-containing protein [Phycisphaerales bacterium]
MTPLEIIIYLALMILGIILSALWSGLETGMYVLNPVRLAVKAAHNDPRAVAIRRELMQPARLLAALLIATNASSYLASYSIAKLLTGFELSGWGLIIIETAIFTPTLFIFAETLPKDLFRTHSDVWTYRLARTVHILRWVLTITLLLPTIQCIAHLAGLILKANSNDNETARQRVLQLIREGIAVGVVSEAQTTLADRMLTLRERRVRDEMVPWAGVATVSLEDPLPTRLAWVAARHHTRFPVVDQSGRAVGVLSMLEALLEPNTATQELIQPAFECPADMSVTEALASMRVNRQALAIVTDPKVNKDDSGNNVVGIVTLKDLVEPLTGELHAW